MRSYINFVFLIFISVLLIACDSDDDDDSSRSGDTITETAVATEDLSTLVTALQAAGLDATLNSEDDTFTVFAPTNEAFAKLGEEALNALLSDPDALSNILLYHVIAGQEINAEAAVDSAGGTVEMANGDSVALSLSGSDLLVNFSTVITTDIEASNGIVHLIDTVLLPPAPTDASTTDIIATAQAVGGFTSLLAALDATMLTETLQDPEAKFTVFAPTDDAIAALGTLEELTADLDALTTILLSHVLEGEVNSIAALSNNNKAVPTLSGESVNLLIVDQALTVNNATIVQYDIQTSNGIIHVIDAVILPPEG
jgi:uncharacterized surface protein with fasciclin (FAS1) repeats